MEGDPPSIEEPLEAAAEGGKLLESRLAPLLNGGATGMTRVQKVERFVARRAQEAVGIFIAFRSNKI